ncbi:MAG TPA: IPTL-CTERM sorting domain-containing protein [Thermodesulfobacteriota bacterium]|nr:IPTL-CTERM sorting domain-containing protein [Thermodesulfobacteriota bacterium]
MRKLLTVFLIFCALVISYKSSYSQVLPAGTLFVAMPDDCGFDPGFGDSTLYRIDPATGVSTVIGPIGFAGVSGLAFLPDGRLVGSAEADENGTRVAVLIEIDPFSGQGNVIGEIGREGDPNECGRVPDLTYYNDQDILYGWGDACPGGLDRLLQINTTTGQGTIIGPIGFNGFEVGLAISENGTLFGAQIFNLININRNTGQGTFLTNIASTFNALDFNPITGVLYGSVLDTPSDRLLATLNPGDGSVEIISVLPVCSDALVFSPFELSQRTTIPAISEWGMMILAGVLGVIAFCSAVRRKYSYRQ